ncbi:MAG: plastocyanin/azurin family copper-binding protein [Kofleriaceae bacterium]
MKRLAWLCCVVAAVACGGDDEHVPVDAAVVLDAPPPIDAAIDAALVDAAVPDAPVTVDAMPPDAVPPDAAAAMLNGCTQAGADDRTGAAASRAIAFGGAAGLAYSPACMRIAAGQAVTFNGSFAGHPLQAGTVVGATAQPMSGGPITATTVGTTATFTFPTAGAYPYYCDFHFTGGMAGVIYVE